MSNVQREAIKEAYNAITDSQEASTADAGFDGGEFSGPAHGDLLDAKLDMIATKYGMTRQELDAALIESHDPEWEQAVEQAYLERDLEDTPSIPEERLDRGY